MSGEDLQKQTSINIQEKANLIWAIADKLVGLYKPHEYGKVILPMCVIKRFEDTLAPTKDDVIKMNEELETKGIAVKKGFLEAAAKQKFCSITPASLLSTSCLLMRITSKTTLRATSIISPRT